MLQILSCLMMILYLVNGQLVFDVLCDADEECKGQTVGCPPGTECAVGCLSKGACTEAILDASGITNEFLVSCGVRANVSYNVSLEPVNDTDTVLFPVDTCKAATVNCSDPQDLCAVLCAGPGACLDLTIDGGENDGTVLLYCLTEEACKETVVDCVGSDECLVYCLAKEGCDGVIVDAAGSRQLGLFCRKENACKAQQVNCTNVEECAILCDENTSCEDMTVDAAQSGEFGMVCAAEEACKAAGIDCSQSEMCAVICDGEESCDAVTVDATQNENFAIECDGEDACKGAQVDCGDSGTCLIFCYSELACSDLLVTCEGSCSCTCEGDAVGCDGLKADSSFCQYVGTV